jgi:hypothetical protein
VLAGCDKHREEDEKPGEPENRSPPQAKDVQAQTLRFADETSTFSGAKVGLDAALEAQTPDALLSTVRRPGEIGLSLTPLTEQEQSPTLRAAAALGFEKRKAEGGNDARWEKTLKPDAKAVFLAALKQNRETALAEAAALRKRIECAGRPGLLKVEDGSWTGRLTWTGHPFDIALPQGERAPRYFLPVRLAEAREEWGLDGRRPTARGGRATRRGCRLSARGSRARGDWRRWPSHNCLARRHFERAYAAAVGTNRKSKRRR